MTPTTSLQPWLVPIVALATVALATASTQAAPTMPVDDVTVLLDDFDGDGIEDIMTVGEAAGNPGDPDFTISIADGPVDVGNVTLQAFGSEAGLGDLEIRFPSAGDPPGDAELFAFLDGYPDNFTFASLVSKTAVDTSQVFTVRWDIDDIDSFESNSEGYRVGLSDSSGGGFDLNIFIDWGREVEIDAPGQTIIAGDQSKTDAASATWVRATIDSTGYLFEFSTGSDVTGNWDNSGVFDALSDANGMTWVTAGFQDRSGKFTGDSTSFVEFDKIEVFTVPEPASLALMGVGGLLIWPRRRR